VAHEMMHIVISPARTGDWNGEEHQVPKLDGSNAFDLMIEGSGKLRMMLQNVFVNEQTQKQIKLKSNPALDPVKHMVR